MNMENNENNRRSFLKKVAAGSIMVTGGINLLGAKTEEKVPEKEWNSSNLSIPNPLNVIWITCDEMTTRAMSIFGNPHTKMPAAEQLASEGISFSNAYVQMPKSVPSRVSMITGRYPHCEGHRTLMGKMDFEPNPDVKNNMFAITAKEPNLVKLLRDNGYKTCLMGKNHLVDWNLHKVWFDDTSHWDSDEWKNRPEKKFEKVSEDLRHAHFRGKLDENIDYDQLEDALYANWSIDFIRKNRDNNFFALIDIGLPHPDYFELTKMPSFQIPLDQIQLNDALPIDKCPSVERQYRTSYNLENLTIEERKRIRRAYYTMCEFADRQVKKIVDEVDKLGLKERTLIIYCADHGDFNGSRNCYEKWDTMFYDEIVKVPLIMRLPGILPPNAKFDQLVEFVDIAPTILDVFGVEKPVWMQGKSLLPLMQGKTAEHKDAVFCQGGVEKDATLRPAEVKLNYSAKQKVVHDFPQSMIRSKMIRMDKYKYIYRLEGDCELYDLENDPEEIKNLATSADHKEVINKLQERMLKFTIEMETNYPIIDFLYC
jgi:arylsulfatase A-like enzyme